MTYNPKTGGFNYIPVCSWRLHNKQLLRESADAYAERGERPEGEAKREVEAGAGASAES